MTTTTIDIRDAQLRWSELLALVLNGNEVLVTQSQTPIMRLVPVAPVLAPEKNGTKQRIPGLHAGMGWVSDDFDAPLPLFP